MPKSDKKQPHNQNLKESKPPIQPQIQMRTGMIVIAIISIGLAVLTAYQAIPIKGQIEGILWGLIFGSSIWLIFFGAYLFNRFLRKG